MHVLDGIFRGFTVRGRECVGLDGLVGGCESVCSSVSVGLSACLFDFALIIKLVELIVLVLILGDGFGVAGLQRGERPVLRVPGAAT
jgi:hypothetical protein